MTDNLRTFNSDLYIVGVGASAGGLEALERFFGPMTSQPQIAFLVVQHLSPDYKSHMAELLAKYTKMTIHEASDGVEVEAGNIYLLPPRNNMTIFNDKLYLVEYDRGHLNLPIDIMLQSLAKAKGNKAIGCILSGTGSDGTRGIRAIKDQGGVVLVQDETAKFDGMPRSAIATQLVDYVAPPEGMAEIILRYVSHPNPINNDLLQSKLITEKDLIGKILAILRDQVGTDFTGYKPNTLVRRIERRMSLFEINALEHYISFLQSSDAERKTLAKEFLIGVTSFFRDADAFETIKNNVIPAIMAEPERHRQIRVWVAGCSTGEEPYSLAMLFQDYMERNAIFVDVKIFATDIDHEALDRASHGLYAESLLADIPDSFLQNYFVKQGDFYGIAHRIRSMVVFANHNLISDPPFSRIDLVVCRNLLIYMQPDVQSHIFSSFQFSLNPGGFLFLGSSESLGDKGDDFAAEDSKWKIYRFRGKHTSLNHLHMRPIDQSRLPVVSERGNAQKTADWRNSDPVLRSLVEQVLPPCLVVDESRTLIHAFGDIEPFVRIPKGYQVTLNVTNMVDDALLLPLNTALSQTFKTSKEITYHDIQIQKGDTVIQVSITTRIFWEHAQNQKLALILFSIQTGEPVAASTGVYTINEDVTLRINNLEQELQFTRENLQSTIEELETSNEELQATNEEMMAANEELQSNNEEMESVNEELLTVNNEYQAKIKELSSLNDDINNLLKSIDVGTLFLDGELKVRKFTPAAQQYINLMEQDIGRPISHFANSFVDFDLISAVRDVIEKLTSANYEVKNKADQWLQVRIIPYRTHRDQINGVVITMIDVTILKRAVNVARKSDEYAQNVLNSLKAHIAVLDKDGIIVTVNHAWQKFAVENGGPLQKTDIGVNYLEICRTAAGYNTEGAFDCYTGLRALLNGEITEFTLEYPCHSPDQDRWFLLRAVPLNTGDGHIVVSHNNVTEYKEFENELRHLNDRLELSTVIQPQALFENDLTLRYTWLHNTGVLYPPLDCINQTDADYLIHTDAERLMGLKRLALKRRERVIETIDMTNKIGQTFRCTMVMDPLFDASGRIIGLIGNAHDFIMLD